MREDLLKGLTDEQIARVEACKSSDELLKLAKEEGVELSDEQLQAISGGFCSSSDFRWKCPNCGSTDTEVWERYNQGRSDEYVRVHCNSCNHNFLKT